jgi:uncharacterized protein
LDDPPSPCTSVCKLTDEKVCRGCGRHIDEIIEWFGASAERKHQIIAAAKRRQAQDPKIP